MNLPSPREGIMLMVKVIFMIKPTMSMSSDLIRVSPELMRAQFEQILLKHGFTGPKAALVAGIFMENSLDGVYTHGVNRFPRFIRNITDGVIDVNAEAECVGRAGAVEQWEGNSGPGPLNAIRCTRRAVDLARETGIGCVALAHTNHWMRGGTYGWQAARQGCAFVGWTNTIANMPIWGGTEPKLGNNPLVMAVPHKEEAIVLDMAMSQFSFGALELKSMKGEKLPVPGGYDNAGKLSVDPGDILSTRRVLPAGYWKGAGLSLLLDILASILSGGLSVRAISEQKEECNLSQVFIAVALDKLRHTNSIASLVDEIIADYHKSDSEGNNKAVYPGERVIKTRHDNQHLGIPVIRKTWEEVLDFGK